MFSPLIKSIHIARNYTNASRTSAQMDVVVIHTMESPETAATAENVAAWFAGSSAPQASAHYCVDSDSIVGCVHEEDIAWAAPGNNHNGIQIELAGRAGQTAEQWHDAFSQRELDKASRLVADICDRRGIPIRHLTNEQLRAGERGIIGHVQASQVWKRSTHTDPGPNFPWSRFIAQVKEFAAPPKVEYEWILRANGRTVYRAKTAGRLMAKMAAHPWALGSTLVKSLSDRKLLTGVAASIIKRRKP